MFLKNTQSHPYSTASTTGAEGSPRTRRKHRQTGQNGANTNRCDTETKAVLPKKGGDRPRRSVERTRVRRTRRVSACSARLSSLAYAPLRLEQKVPGALRAATLTLAKVVFCPPPSPHAYVWKGETPCHKAARSHHVQTLEFLQAVGADMNTTNDEVCSGNGLSNL